MGREGHDVIWDSGALDKVTGERYALHNFKKLPNTISVKVATDRPFNYITGTGTLKFFGTNRTITLLRMSPTVRTLGPHYSLAAFKKSDAHFQVRHNFETIDLVSQLGRLLIPSTFYPQNNTWPVSKSLQETVSFSSPNLSFNTLAVPSIEINSIFQSPNLDSTLTLSQANSLGNLEI